MNENWQTLKPFYFCNWCEGKIIPLFGDEVWGGGLGNSLVEHYHKDCHKKQQAHEKSLIAKETK